MAGRAVTINGIPESDYFRLAVEAAPNAMIMVNADGEIVLVNDQTERMFGYSREELLGSPVELLINEAIRDKHVEYRDEYLSDPAVRPMGVGRELLALRKDGTEFPVEIGLNPIRTKSGMMVLAAVVDISERRRVEKAEEELEDRMRHSQKLESLGVLAGGIAHDFNNLLTAVLGNAELARNRLEPDSPALRYVERVIGASQRAADLTRQMLAYSGRGKFETKPVDIAAAIREIGELLHVSISKRCTMEFDFADDLPMLMADPAQLNQVIMNLVTNANEALGEKGGTIHVRAYPIVADAEFLKQCYGDFEVKPGKFVCFEVSDTGSGMDDETIERIFDPFFTTKFTGRGLGLSAVLGIMRSHTGAIQVDTTPGRGTTMRVLFPTVKTSPLVSDSERRPATWQGKGKVLLADDEELVRDVTRMQLETLGFEVYEAANGMDALQLFGEHDFVAAVLDLTMPQMNGDAVAMHLLEARPDLPVLLISGYTAHELSENPHLGKQITLLAKPFTAEELATTLRRLMSGSE
jgi:PAS domain S-box-containing protein